MINAKLVKLNLLCGISLLLLAVFAVSASAQDKRGQVINSGQVETKQGTIEAQLPPPKSLFFKTPPDPQPIKKAKPPVLPMVPVDPSARPEDIRPTSPETVANIKTEAELSAPQAPGTFTLFRNTLLPSAPVLSGVTLNGFIPIEPSVANNGRVVFYTTNSYSSLSGDGGQTFTHINPFDYFPPDGTNDPIDGGFGGDQYTFYEPTRGLMFWILQYGNNGTTNRQRLCITRSQTETLGGGCSYFLDFSPASFGIPTPAGAGGTWLDFPDIAVSDNFLYLSSNVFCTSGCPLPQAIGAVIWRIALNDLRQPGTIGFAYSYNSTEQQYRFSQGAGATMYWGTHRNTAQIRIYRWLDSSGSFAFDDVTHTAYNQGAMTANSPDGTNFAGNANANIQAAWVAAGVIGFMWNAAQGGSFPFPHVQVLRFNESNRSLLSQGQVWSSSYAFLYPSVQTNARGHLGGTMAWGGGTLYPNALAWIADDFNNNTITPLENVTFAAGSAGPNENRPGGAGIYNRWGDYHSTRVHRPYSNTWIGTGFVYQASPPPPTGISNQREPHYAWFGRERDTPPANNSIFVSLANTTGYEDGTILHPYNTVGEGNFAATSGDVISIVPGNYNELPRLNRASRLERFGASGTVKIGP